MLSINHESILKVPGFLFEKLMRNLDVTSWLICAIMLFRDLKLANWAKRHAYDKAVKFYTVSQIVFMVTAEARK